MYKPLPESLTIKTSKVNGLGLFAKEAIPQATNLGMTHIKMGDHISIKDIQKGEELTLKYTFYDI